MKELRSKRRGHSMPSTAWAVTTVSDTHILPMELLQPRSRVVGFNGVSGDDLPWQPRFPFTSLYVALPTAVHEAEHARLPLGDASLQWRLSLWAGESRLSDDATAAVLVPKSQSQRPKASSVDSSGSRHAGDRSDAGPEARIIRLDVAEPSDLGSATWLCVELVIDEQVLATSATQLCFAAAPAASIPVQGVDKAGASVSLVATPTVHVAAGASTPLHAMLFAPAGHAPVLLATFVVTLHATRRFHALTPHVRAVSPLAHTASDFLLPGRSDLYVSVEAAHAHPLHATAADAALAGLSLDMEPGVSPLSPSPGAVVWPTYTVVVVLSRGNGELVAGPRLVGTLRCDAVTSSAPSATPPRASTLLTGLESRSERAAMTVAAASVAGCAWLGSFRRMVQVGLPEEGVASVTGKSHLHLLWYLLSPPTGGGAASGGGRPVVVGFSYLGLRPDAADLLIPDGRHVLKVTRVLLLRCVAFPDLYCSRGTAALVYVTLAPQLGRMCRSSSRCV
jgi:hypothetical protein